MINLNCVIRDGHQKDDLNLLLYLYVVIRDVSLFDWVVRDGHQMDDLDLLLYLYVVIRDVD